MKISWFVFGLVLVSLVGVSVQWRGNYCSRTICSYTRIRVCKYRTWRGCCAWKWIWAPNYRTVYYCCTGWTISSYQNCDRAICNPSCKNGGRCVRPNVCQCTDGAIGASCNTLVCNHQRPCFPGTCTAVSGGNPICTCDTGFQHKTNQDSDMCRKLDPDQKPEIYEVSARLSFSQRGTGGPAMEKYSLYVDSTMSDEVDTLWTNRPMFNWLNVTASGFYMTPDNYTVPNFVEDYKIGIAMAEVNILHEKIPLSGSGPPDVALDLTRPCSPEVSSRNPVPDTYYCRISNQTFDRSLENGDTLTITFRVSSGGFRTLQRIVPSQSVTDTQDYEGNLNTKAMAYKFDFVKPTHPCLVSSCTEMFSLDSDITKSPLVLRWAGWMDYLSGMYRYAWEVFELKVDGNLVLREPDPLGPIHGPIEVNQSSSSSNSFSATYRPPLPGVYSFILEASDKANNSVFIRRIAIYDPTSTITLDPNRNLYVSSANPDVDYTWQQDTGASIHVTWENLFVNLAHEQGKWLNRVLKYPKELEDNIKYIPEDSNQDDHDGTRTIDEIPNKRGIVKFEVAKKKDSNNGDGLSTPTSGWLDVFLNETFTIDAKEWTVTNADTVTIWVRATDAMGNTRVESTQVRFDDTPPAVSTDFTFNKDEHAAGIPFSSSVRLTLIDMESGLKRADVFVYQKDTNIPVSNFTMPIPSIPKSECNSVADGCYCPPARGVCFDKVQVLAISNCKLFQAENPNAVQSVDIRIDFLNMAGLTSSKSFSVSGVTTLNGTKSYLGPMNLEAINVDDTSATVTWTHSSSCFERTEMWISYKLKDNVVMRQLHHSATSETLNNLEPNTDYAIELISQYGTVKSTPVKFSFRTTGGLSAGAIAGIVIGMLLLLIIILVIVGLVLFKLGMLSSLVDRRNKYRETRRVEAPIIHNTAAKQNNRVSKWAFENTTYNKDEEIYIYGSMDLGEPYYVPPDDLTLMEEISTGRFAKIYKAKWRESPKNVKEVAAKVLKARESEDAIMLMLAKINFAATQVGEHRNIVSFLGAVMDNDALGPVMVLEYCETGQLDKWLLKKRSKVGEDVLDRIQNFALEIARAMEYLSNKGIVHRKLAARNCLLTFLLEIKVTGFGPCQSDESPDDGKGDRIPIKWTAPECLKSLKNADQKSDVWSYGIVLWEIFSMGGSPYADIRGRDLPTKVKGGYRLARPEYAEDLHYRMMQDCWSDSPVNRPVFRNIVDNLEASFGLQPADGDQNYYYQR